MTTTEPHPPDPEPNPDHRRGLDETVAVLIREFKLVGDDAEDFQVLDIGCNTGNWLRAFEDAGVEFTLGCDLPHLKPHLVCNPNAFFIRDLSEPYHPCPTDSTVRLVLCLEVGEHLPQERARDLVARCCHWTRGGGAVLFSAAVPGQGGHGHVNEQPHAYWRDLFAAEGYSWDESIRAKLPESLAAYYRNNMAVCRRLPG